MIITETRGAYKIVTEIHATRFDGSIEIRHVRNEIVLPNNDLIILASEYKTGEVLSLYDISHNIFRLDAYGNVIWQVQRDEQHQTEWWAMAHRKAARGNEEMQRKIRDPFARLSATYFKRGIYNEFEPTPSQHESAILKPDFILLAWVYGRGVYELDIETGIAKNVTQLGGRDW